jgi:S1-C subfamily serine protease
MTEALVNLSNELAEIVRAVDPSVVSLQARRHYPSSGVRLGAELIVTASHTLEREEEVAVTLADGTAASAALIGRDSGTDLALLKISPAPAPIKELEHAAELRAGELTIVVGRSPDSGVNASLGIVSALSGPWRTWRGGELDAYIRLDARLFPQSSGGAVVNARGQFVGIATSALSRIAGLAIPASSVKSVTEKLLQRGFVPRGYLGIGVQPVPIREDLQQKLKIPIREGLIVLTVEKDGPADLAGILPGDIVAGIGDAAVEKVDDLRKYSDSGVIGQQVTITFVRGGEVRKSQITVAERPRRRS